MESVRVLTLSKRNVKEIIRDPLSLIFTLLMPEAMLFIFYYAFHDMTAQFEMKYLCPALVVFAQAFLTLFSALLISLDREDLFITRLYVSGTRSGEFIAGYFFSLLPVAIVQAVLIFATGVIIEPSFASVYVLAGVAFSVLTAALFIGFGILFGSLCSAKSVGGVSSIIITGQSLLSGMWFPLDGLSKSFVVFMKVLPFKNAAELLGGAADGFNFADGFIRPFIITVGYTLITLVVAVFAFARNMIKK